MTAADKVEEKPFDGKSFTKRLPTGPGVYVMFAEQGDVLYVGKAANLRKRVASYFDARPKVDRTMRMVARIAKSHLKSTK